MLDFKSPIQGLLDVHSRCGLHTRAVTNSRHANRRLQPFRYLHDCSDCFRLERLPGGACTHWKAPPCHGAHPNRTSGACRLMNHLGHLTAWTCAENCLRLSETGLNEPTLTPSANVRPRLAERTYTERPD